MFGKFVNYRGWRIWVWVDPHEMDNEDDWFNQAQQIYNSGWLNAGGTFRQTTEEN